MASTVPAKSQPLHNLALPHLKWKKNHHRDRFTKLSSSSTADPDSAAASSSPSPHSPAFHSPTCGNDWGSESGKSKSVVTAQQNDGKIATFEKKHKAAEIVNNNKGGSRSKILLKLPRKIRVEEEQKGDEEKETTESKTWNLRPRTRTMSMNGGGSAMQLQDNNTTHSFQPNTAERMKRHRICISLSREEIEDDIFALTGSKPARRPKKRAKAVRKQLDTLFPGLWLASITPDSYKVSETLPKV